MRNAVKYGPIVGLIYIASILAANYLTTRYGFVPVGFGEVATAGTFAAGGALVVRDLLQDAIGRRGVVVMILVGSALSYLIADPAIATASTVAFLLGETLDMTVYTPLRKRGELGSAWWGVAVLAGAVVGAVVDSIAFLWIAFGRDSIEPALLGQMIGKLEVALAIVAVGWCARAVFRKPVD